ncbi:MAG: PH domain-containing protein [Nocardioidaceae bacterium]
MSSLLRGLLDPRIGRHLLREEGEVIVDEVEHHWVVYAVPTLEGLAGFGLLYVMMISPPDIAWVPMVLGLGVLVHATWKALVHHMDRFVITNMRVFRVRGVVVQRLATMPLRKVLDITVEKPVLGRVLDYGHFVFESAAQEQGLRDIRFVPRPYERDRTIQSIIQRSGLRGPGIMY